jgi:glutathione S-transferase
MQESIRLWGAGTSRTLRPVWVAEELGVPYELVPIGPRTGETQTEAYTRLNPRQKIPTLEHGDFALSESVAICRYLVERFPAAAIYRPQSPLDRAREDEWCCFVYGELDETSLYVMRRHGDLAYIYGEAPAALAAAKAYAQKYLEVAARELDGRLHVMPGGFGLADVLLTSCLDWAVDYGLELPASLGAYRAHMRQRAGYRRAFAANYDRRR